MTAPIRFSARSATADFMVAPGSMLVTSRPLAAIMMLTVIVASLRPHAPICRQRVGLMTLMFAEHSRFHEISRSAQGCDAAGAKILGARSQLSAWFGGQFR